MSQTTPFFLFTTAALGCLIRHHYARTVKAQDTARSLQSAWSSPQFLKTLRFRPGIDWVNESAFTAFSPDYGEVIVVLKQGAPQTPAQARAAQMAKAKSVLQQATCSLVSNNVAYSYFDTAPERGTGRKSNANLHTERICVILLSQLKPSAAHKAICKRFPATATRKLTGL